MQKWAAPRRTEIAAVAESKIWILEEPRKLGSCSARVQRALKKPMRILAYGYLMI